MNTRKTVTTSYGIISYKKFHAKISGDGGSSSSSSSSSSGSGSGSGSGKSESSIKFLMVQRKYSFSMAAIINYFTDLNETLVIGLTPTERYILLNHDFLTIWKSFWTNEWSKEYNRNKYQESIVRFERMKVNFKEFFDRYPAQSEFTEWEFPKGKKTRDEEECVAAIREFGEETHISKDKLTLLECEPLRDDFVGDDHRHYCYKYWIAECPEDTLTLVDSAPSEQSNEIVNIGWFTTHEVAHIVTAKRFELITYICEHLLRISV